MKKINELIKKYHNYFSTIIVVVYFLIQLLIMFLNYKSETKVNIDIWYKATVIIGIISFIVGVINLLFNIKKINIKKIGLFSLIVILLAFCFFAAINSYDKTLAFSGENYRHVSFYTYLLFLGFFINSINVEKKHYKILGTILLIIATIICIIALLNNNFTYKFFYKNNFPYNGIFMHQNHLGYYLSICSIIAVFLTIYEKNTIKKIIYYLITSILFITLIANDTFGSYLAVLITLLIILFYLIIKKKNRMIIYIILLFTILSSILSTSNGVLVKNNFTKLFFDVDVIKQSSNESMVENTGTKRVKLWKYAIKVIKHKPLGIGPNNLTRYYKAFKIKEAVPHNFLLEVAVYNGIPALIVYLILLGFIFINNLKKLNNSNIVLLCCMISYLISAFFGNMFFYTSPYFVIIMGLLSRDIVCDDNRIYNN